jgi:hypothetical protein
MLVSITVLTNYTASVRSEGPTSNIVAQKIIIVHSGKVILLVP